MKCPDCGKANIAGEAECQACQASLANVGASSKRGLERRIIEGVVASLKPKTALEAAPSDSLQSAIDKMRQARSGCVLVVEGGILLGIFSERELIMRAKARTDWGRTTVRELMRDDSVCLREDDEVAFAFNRMAMSGNRHVPVRMNDGGYGVVSARDLLRYLCQ